MNMSNIDNKIGLVIPCYNEENRLPVGAFEEFIVANSNVFFCFSNDGSSDSTAKILRELRAKFPNQVVIEELVKNMGKAEAVRRGVFKIKKEVDDLDYVGYFDADLATPLSELFYLIRSFNTKERVMVFGSRWSRLGADISRSNMRHYLGRIIATGISITLGLPINDSQCGAKLFSSKLCDELFKDPFSTTWLFDVEIFARLVNKYGHKKMSVVAVEVPLNKWTEIEGSKVSLWDGLTTFYHLWAIRRRYKI